MRSPVEDRPGSDLCARVEFGNRSSSTRPITRRSAHAARRSSLHVTDITSHISRIGRADMGSEVFTKPSLVGRYDTAKISRALAAAVGAVAAAWLAGASAQAMGLVEQTPAVNEIMSGSTLAFA